MSNLYPFEETDAAGAPWDEATETIDPGRGRPVIERLAACDPVAKRACA